MNVRGAYTGERRLAFQRFLRVGAFVLGAVSTSAQAVTTAGDDARSQDPGPAQASPPEESDVLKHVKFGVTIEGYYEFNSNRPPDRILQLRAYDTRSNSFSLQQGAFVVEFAPDVAAGRRYGARADLQFGMATDTVQGNPANEPRPEAYRNIWQMYGSYVLPVGANGLQVDFGKYASMLGYETNYAKDNQAFSRAYLFNFLPFYHSGVRLTLPVNDKLSLLYMLSNGVQQTEDFNNFKSHHVATILKPTSTVTWTVNYYVGEEQPDGSQPDGPDGVFKVFDTYISVAPISELSVALDVNHASDEADKSDHALSLNGVGAYARYQLTKAGALGVRYERLDDAGLFSGVRQVLYEATMTAEYKFGDGFLLRGEFRRDWSTAPFFSGPLGTTDLRGDQKTALIGAVWWFGNKRGAW